MSSIDRDLELWELLCRRAGQRRGLDGDIEVHTKGMSIRWIGEEAVDSKAVDVPQAQEAFRQFFEEISRNGWTQEAQKLLLRVQELLSSNPKAPSSPDAGEGDQAEKSGWQNPNSEFAPAFRLSEGRRGLRDAATTQAKGRVLQEANLALLQSRLMEAEIAQKSLREAVERPDRERAREAFDNAGQQLREQLARRGKSPP